MTRKRGSFTTRNAKIRYTSMDEEGGLNDTDTPDETQGYLCVSADPRRSGSVEGGEDFILTVEELRLSLQTESPTEDQTVWLTTTQVGFPTTVIEGELDNILDREIGKPTVRCLHPVISDYHVTLIHNGMDHHEWDMELPPQGLGSHPGHTSQDTSLM